MNNRISFEVKILTLFPEMFPGLLSYSLAGKALEKNIWKMDIINIRDYATDNYKRVDDVPYGGGPGMIMRPDILAKAYDANQPMKNWSKIVLTPRGKPLSQKLVKKIASKPGVLLVCGRYEGIDERFIESRSLEEISVGDYVLSGGEPAAFIVLDSVIRLLSGTAGSPESLIEESFENNNIEYPQYTRPYDWEGLKPPKVLVSGNHKEIEKWKKQTSIKDTEKRRPDILYSEKK